MNGTDKNLTAHIIVSNYLDMEIDLEQTAEYTGVFREVIEYLKLGELIEQPYKVTGGYLHKMFKLVTTTGKYAVKLLNPIIMKRPDAIDHYKRAEQIERVLCDDGIPVIPAMEVNGLKLFCLDTQYFYVFEWVDAQALGWHKIREHHCRMIGSLLAKIHKIQTPKYTCPGAKFDVDWDRYINLAKEKGSELAEALSENRKLLYLAQKEYNTAVDSAPDIVCISNADMDCKNVLWENGNPMIIDLESLDYGNPFLEMLQLALSWAGGVVCDINFANLNEFIKAYQSEYGEVAVDWKKLSGVGFIWLDWLEYNTKRALWIECGDEQEQRLGIREARETIGRIVYYDSIREDMIKIISNIVQKRWTEYGTDDMRAFKTGNSESTD